MPTLMPTSVFATRPGAAAVATCARWTTRFAPWISKGGHIGGFVGGILGLLLVSRFGRRRVVGGARFDALGVAGIVAVGVLSVAVAFWQVGLT